MQLTNRILINREDAYVKYGLLLNADSLSQLVKQPSYKSIETVDWHEEDGMRADLSDVHLATRTIKLTFTAVRPSRGYPLADSNGRLLVDSVARELHSIANPGSMGSSAKMLVDYLTSRPYSPNTGETGYNYPAYPRAGVYIEFPLIGYEGYFRFLSSSSFSTNRLFDTFTLQFIEDHPVISQGTIPVPAHDANGNIIVGADNQPIYIQTLIPVADYAVASDYTISTPAGIFNIAAFGIYVLEGTRNSFLAPQSLKTAITTTNPLVGGNAMILSYPGEKYSDITLKLHLRANILDFWARWKCFWSVLTSTDSELGMNSALRTISAYGRTISCYYKSCAVQKLMHTIEHNGQHGLWCDFSVTFSVLKIEDED